MQDPTPDVWNLLFEQTPPTLRWLLGFLTFGLFTAARYFYGRSNARLTAIEEREHNYVHRDELAVAVHDLRKDVRQVLARIDGLYQMERNK